MSKPAEIEAMVRPAKAEFGGWTSWSTTPASSTWRHREDFPVERWDAIIAINLSSAFHTMRAGAARHEEAQLGPHHQHRLGARPGGLGQKSAYVAAKHGIVGLTKVAALETPPPASRSTPSARAGC
jgi:3-hydroxybutyrate dehydrogenase